MSGGVIALGIMLDSEMHWEPSDSCLWSFPPWGNVKCVGVMALQKFPADQTRVWAGWLVGNSLGTFVLAAVSWIISLLILPAYGQWEICGNDEAHLKGSS